MLNVKVNFLENSVLNIAIILGSAAVIATDNCGSDLIWSQHNLIDIGLFNITVNATDISGNIGIRRYIGDF